MNRRRPLRRLLLLDVLSDHNSRPVFLWAGGTLLLGTLAYHWLEGGATSMLSISALSAWRQLVTATLCQPHPLPGCSLFFTLSTV